MSQMPKSELLFLVLMFLLLLLLILVSATVNCIFLVFSQPKLYEFSKPEQALPLLYLLGLCGILHQMSVENKQSQWIETTAYPIKERPKFEKHALKFEIHAKCQQSRCSTLTLPHGPCRTPMFMPFVNYLLYIYRYVCLLVWELREP